MILANAWQLEPWVAVSPLAMILPAVSASSIIGYMEHRMVFTSSSCLSVCYMPDYMVLTVQAVRRKVQNSNEAILVLCQRFLLTLD